LQKHEVGIAYDITGPSGLASCRDALSNDLTYMILRRLYKLCILS
jgi:hypothetical protein